MQANRERRVGVPREYDQFNSNLIFPWAIYIQKSGPWRDFNVESQELAEQHRQRKIPICRTSGVAKLIHNGEKQNECRFKWSSLPEVLSEETEHLTNIRPSAYYEA